MSRRAHDARGALQAGERYSVTLDDLEFSAVEGGILEFLGRRRERDPKLRKLKIDFIVSSGIALSCEVCAFNFGARYGDHGEGYIEVHHIRPLYDSGETRTTLRDLALLCSNCHRMCHREGWITPNQLRSMLAPSP